MPGCCTGKFVSRAPIHNVDGRASQGRQHARSPLLDIKLKRTIIIVYCCAVGTSAHLVHPNHHFVAASEGAGWVVLRKVQAVEFGRPHLHCPPPAACARVPPCCQLHGGETKAPFGPVDGDAAPRRVVDHLMIHRHQPQLLTRRQHPRHNRPAPFCGRPAKHDPRAHCRHPALPFPQRIIQCVNCRVSAHVFVHTDDRCILRPASMKQAYTSAQFNAAWLQQTHTHSRESFTFIAGRQACARPVVVDHAHARSSCQAGLVPSGCGPRSPALGGGLGGTGRPRRRTHSRRAAATSTAARTTRMPTQSRGGGIGRQGLYVPWLQHWVTEQLVPAGRRAGGHYSW